MEAHIPHYHEACDYYSRLTEVAKLDNISVGSMILLLKNIFSRHGIPKEVVMNKGPQFESNAFHKFGLEYQFCHKTSSA